MAILPVFLLTAPANININKLQEALNRGRSLHRAVEHFTIDLEARCTSLECISGRLHRPTYGAVAAFVGRSLLESRLHLFCEDSGFLLAVSCASTLLQKIIEGAPFLIARTTRLLHRDLRKLQAKEGTNDKLNSMRYQGGRSAKCWI